MKIAIQQDDGRDQRVFPSCEEAAREWIGRNATATATALGRVCDLLADETSIDRDKIAAALLGPSGRAR